MVLAKSLVDTRTDAPNVIVNGEVEVEFTNTNLTADERTRAQAVLNKIAVIVDHDLYLVNTASPTTAMALPNLTFVDGDVEIEGFAASLPKLLCISEDLIIDYSGDISFPVLANIDDDVVVNSRHNLP